MGGEEGPESDAEAELLTSRGEGRSFFVAVRFLVAARFGLLRGDGVTSVSSVLDARFFVAARFGWLRGVGTASESSVFESVSGTLAEVCAGFFFFAFAFGRGRGRGRV